MNIANKFVRVVGKGHSKCMIEHIRECWDKECYSNVRFVCKQQTETAEKPLSANKAVLAASSPKLGLMLSDTGEEEDVTIIIPESDFSIVKMLLQYIYSGEVIVDSLTKELAALINDWDIAFPDVVPLVPSKDLQENSCSEVVADLNLSPSPNRLRSATHQRSKEEGQLPSEQSPLYKQLVQAENIDLPAETTESAAIRPKSTAQRSRTSSNRSVDESSGNYVFLAAYLKNSNFKDRVGETPVVPEKKNAKKKNPPNIEPSINDADGQFDGKETPKKRPRIQPSQKSTTVENGNSSTDVAPGIDDSLTDESKDTEEDKADEILSKAFFEEEKARQKLMNELADSLKGSIARHKLYVKHFLGSDVQPSKPQNQKNQNKQDVPRIPCVTCGKLISRDYMKEHTFIHTKERPFLCEQCGATFSLADRLRKHVKFAHPDESDIQSFACTVCNKVFKKASYLQRHITLHSGQKPYNCPYCDKSFRLPNVLVKHKRTHTGERPYECETCHKKFSSRSNYVTHLRTHRKRAHVLTEAGSGMASAVDPETQLLKCNICGTSFHREYAFLIHVAAHNGEDPKLPCRHCSETFASHRLLKEHAREQHADALFQCDQCPSMFINRTTLNAHILIHSEGKKHPCEDCNKEFQTKVQLEIHRKSVHSEERPFACRFCSKGFKSKLVLRQHERIHTGERPYKCPHCSKCFRQDVHLANHIRIHTGEKPFACGYCNKAFSHQNNLRIHEKIHTGDKNQCGTCGQVFRSVVKLRQHENTHVFQEEGLEADVLNEGMREDTRDHLQESEED